MNSMQAWQSIPIALAILMANATVSAQGFTSGSNGSFGPISVTSGTQTIVLPDDGIIHATSVTVSDGARLLFTCNVKNTPVYLLATEDIVIEGIVSVSAPLPNPNSASTSPGGCGGFAGGAPLAATSPPGDGYGPGGGRAGDGTVAVPAGSGAYGSTVTGGGPENGNAYGSNLLVPLVGGSGGGGGFTQGGGGGGAILMAATGSISINGRVLACGGSYLTSTGNPSFGHSGSGGAIRIVANRVSGTGLLGAGGSSRTPPTSSTACEDGPSLGNGFRAAGEGRIRVDTIDRTGFQVTIQNGVNTRALGALMQVSFANMPELYIVEVAGTAIPVGSGPVNVLLPAGSPTQQSVVLRGVGFVGDVPIRLVLTPDSGSRVVVDGTLAMNGQGTADVSLNVDVPANIFMNVAAWVRDN